MDQGRVLQHGGAAAIYHAPRTRTVAEFIGRANWFEGTLGQPVAPGLHEFVTADGRFIVRSDASANGNIGQFCVRPERLRMLTDGHHSREQERAGAHDATDTSGVSWHEAALVHASRIMALGDRGAAG